MPSISLTNPENITNLTLGTSSEAKLGGNIDLSKFTNLRDFRAVDLDLNSVVGFEELSLLRIFFVQENILSSDPLPTFANTSMARFNISDTEIGPSAVIDGWAIPSTMQQFRAIRTNLGGAKRDILTAFYHKFKDNTDNVTARRLFVTDSNFGALDPDSFLTGDYNTITVLAAKNKLTSIGFLLAGF